MNQTMYWSMSGEMWRHTKNSKTLSTYETFKFNVVALMALLTANVWSWFQAQSWCTFTSDCGLCILMSTPIRRFLSISSRPILSCLCCYCAYVQTQSCVQTMFLWHCPVISLSRVTRACTRANYLHRAELFVTCWEPRLWHPVSCSHSLDVLCAPIYVPNIESVFCVWI